MSKYKIQHIKLCKHLPVKLVIEALEKGVKNIQS